MLVFVAYFGVVTSYLLNPTPVVAEQPITGVVELFTSQSCAGCPIADQNLIKLIQGGGVLALSYNVDYWNYLGWPDSLATKENTERQFEYNSGLGRNGVYTPQAIVNGRSHVLGTDLAAIEDKLAKDLNSSAGLQVDITSRLVGDEIIIDIGDGTGSADIVIAYFKRQSVVDVEGGDNQGKTLEYWHSVYDVQVVGRWNGDAQTKRLPASLLRKVQDGGCAIILQRTTTTDKPADIIGASLLIPN